MSYKHSLDEILANIAHLKAYRGGHLVFQIPITQNEGSVYLLSPEGIQRRTESTTTTYEFKVPLKGFGSSDAEEWGSYDEVGESDKAIYFRRWIRTAYESKELRVF